MLVALCCARLALGCSLVGVRTAARDPRAANADEPAALCTKRSWSPLLDLVGFGASAALMTAGLIEDSSVPTALGAGASAGFAVSAGYGFATAPGCSERESAAVATR